MKLVLKLFLHYLTWHRALTWIVTGGLVLVAAAMTGNYFSTGFAYGAAFWGFVAMLGLPYFILPAPFRALIANRRLSQLPGFHVKAGIALFLLTLLVSVFFPATIFILGIEALPPRTAFLFFLVASFYMAYMQWALPLKQFPSLVGFFPWLFLMVLFYMRETMSLDEVINSSWLVPLNLLALIGWGLAIHRLGTKNIFDPPYRVFNPDKEPFRKVWERYDRNPSSSTIPGTLLLGYPDGIRQLLRGTGMWIIVFPALVAMVFALFGLVISGGERLPPMHWTFLATSAMLGGCNTLPNGELAARARLLWLRFGTDRVMQWKHMEKLMFRAQLCIYLWALVSALVLGLSGMFEPVILVNYLLFILAASLYFLYLSLAGRIMHWPDPVKGLSILFSAGILIGTASNALSTENFNILNTLEIVLLFAAFIMRYLARSAFVGIDWYQVQPLNLSKLYGQR